MPSRWCAWCGEPLVTVPVLVVGETRYHELCWQRRSEVVSDPDEPTPRREWGIEVPPDQGPQVLIITGAPPPKSDPKDSPGGV